MRKFLCLCFMAGLPAAVAWGGQMYGSVTEGGKRVGGAGIQIDCAGKVTRGATGSDGSYRLNVPQQGRCRFKLEIHGRQASLEVFSYPNPAKYDFEVARRPDGNVELRRR